MSYSKEAQWLVEDILGWDDHAGGAPGSSHLGGTNRLSPDALSAELPGTPDVATTKTLGDIVEVLPEWVQQHLESLLNSGEDGSGLVEQLKVLLVPHRAALATVGVVPEYFAYMLVYQVLPKLRQQGGQG